MNSRPRLILFLDHTAAMGGGEVALFNLVTRLDRVRYEPHVLLFSDGPLRHRLEAAGARVKVVPLSRRLMEVKKDSLNAGALTRLRDVAQAAAACFRLARLIRALSPDIVHCNSLKSDLIGGCAARLAGARVIWHIRDRIDHDYLPPAAAKAFRALSRLIPTRVIAISHATARTLAPNFRGRLAGRAKVEVVYDGIPIVALSPFGESVGRGAVVSLVGRISRWKGQHVFLHAVARVRRAFPQARFQIIGAALFGEHAYEAEVRALAESLGLKDVVDFTGFRTDVEALIQRSDVIVHASTTGEPFGQVIVEGMAAGKPVVATDGGGVPEIVVHGETGLLVPMGDADAMAEAIKRLLADPAVAAEMGRRGRRRVEERFTIERTARAVEAIYDRLLGCDIRGESEDEIQHASRSAAAEKGERKPQHPIAELRPGRVAVRTASIPDMGAAPAMTTANAHGITTPL